jgi:hypothetical protein
MHEGDLTTAHLDHDLTNNHLRNPLRATVPSRCAAARRRPFADSGGQLIFRRRPGRRGRADRPNAAPQTGDRGRQSHSHWRQYLLYRRCFLVKA